MMILFDGKKFAQEREEQLKLKVAKLREKGTTPKLVSILVGDNPESELYVNLKKKAAERVGIEMEIVRFSEEVKSEGVIECIENLNKDPMVHGVMIQLPLPKQLSINNYQLTILSAIDPKKDVDCLTPVNLGFLLMGDPRIIPATPKAVMEIICFALKKNVQEKKWLAGENVCVIGASNLVGKPLAMMLSNLGATVTVCRSTTSFESLSRATKKANILISAVGKAGLITKQMVKPGAVAIDVGLTNIEMPYGKTKILGDLAKDVKDVVGFFTPVPGGVGPVTIICLLENLIEAINST